MRLCASNTWDIKTCTAERLHFMRVTRFSWQGCISEPTGEDSEYLHKPPLVSSNTSLPLAWVPLTWIVLPHQIGMGRIRNQRHMTNIAKVPSKQQSFIKPKCSFGTRETKRKQKAVRAHEELNASSSFSVTVVFNVHVYCGVAWYTASSTAAL